jgi:hypothetical protein
MRHGGVRHNLGHQPGSFIVRDGGACSDQLLPLSTGDPLMGEAQEFFRGHRPCEKKTLRQLASGGVRQVSLLDGFDAFGDRADPDGQVKLLHLWPVKLLQAGRLDYEASAVTAMRAAASLRR